MEARLQLPVRKGPLRFAIGNPAETTSNSWRMWTENLGDIYLLCCDNYREVKVSLHATGRWRMAITDAAVARNPRLVPPGTNRAWEVWDEPPGTLPDMVTAFRIFFIPSELAVTPSMRSAKQWRGVVFVEGPQPGSISVATLFITRGEPVLNYEGGPSLTLASFPLPKDRYVQLTVHNEPMIEAMRVAIADAIRLGRQQAQEARIQVPPGGRMLFFGNSPDGARFLVEANYHRSNEQEDPLAV